MAKPTTYFTVWNHRGTFLQSGHVINAFTAKDAIEIFLNSYDYSPAMFDGMSKSSLEKFYIEDIFFAVLMNENNTAFNKTEQEIRKVATKFNVKSRIIVHHSVQEDKTGNDQTDYTELVEYYKSIGYSDDEIKELNVVGEKGE